MNEVIVGFIALLNYAVVVCDAMTDAAVNRYSAGWWQWHGCKWCRYYLPQVFILFLLVYNKMIEVTKLNVLAFVAYIVIGWIVWQVMYIANPLSKD